MYCIVYQLKFVNILMVIYINLPDCNDICLHITALQKYSEGKSQWSRVIITNIYGKIDFPIQIHYLCHVILSSL